MNTQDLLSTHMCIDGASSSSGHFHTLLVITDSSRGLVVGESKTHLVKAGKRVLMINALVEGE